MSATKRSSWSYTQASEELDRIIKANDPAQTPSVPKMSTSVMPQTCSICGHSTAHFPIRSSSEVLEAAATPLPGHTHHIHHHNPQTSHTTTSKYSSATSNVSQFARTSSASRNFQHRFSSSRNSHHDPYFHSSHTPRSSTSHYTQTPDSIVAMEAQSAANSVVKAFRELQAKTKMIESERASACAVRDELRQELAEVRRKFNLSRNKEEARSNRHLQSIKASTDEHLISLNYTKSIYQQQKDIEQTQNHKVNELTETQVKLTEDIEKLNSKILASEHRLRKLRESLVSSKEQNNSLERTIGTRTLNERIEVEKEVECLKEAVNKEKVSASRTELRIASLTKYLDIILKVNGDLCKALQSRKNNDDRIAMIAQKQMKKLLKNREAEVMRIMQAASDIGVQKAMHMSRNMDILNDLFLDQVRHSNESFLLENAARMAATSAANAVVAANLSSTSSPSCTACYRPKFIPSSSQSNREFNVVASVSKAAREAKNLNARFASRYGSLFVL